MDPKTTTEPAKAEGGVEREVPYYKQTEDYGGGRIQARHGRVNWWLLLVYLVMFLWALYYGYTFWGGLGPGLNIGQ